MTVSSYQIDNVLKAYNKQQKTKVRFDANHEPVKGRLSDVVTLSGQSTMSKDDYAKISYSLLDILTKNK
jgi:hypothetical protein